MRVVGVNGINTHGVGNIDLVLATMRNRGLETVDVPIPVRHTWTARWTAKSDARTVAWLSEDGDIAVCHSRGAHVMHHAHKLREFKAIICIAPACSKNLEWRNPSRVWCYYSPSDWVVRLGSLLPFDHPFGAAGVEGFSQPGTHNYKMHSDHDDYFDPKTHLGVICDQIWHLGTS